MGDPQLFDPAPQPPGWRPNYGQPGPLQRPPAARRSDPATSHDAAASVSQERRTATQQALLRLLREAGPLTDEDIAHDAHVRPGFGLAGVSPSGLRTRRAELAAAGLVEDSGTRRAGSTGRSMIVWRAVEVSP